MAYTLPTTEPTQARAGDTWGWTRTLADWPAGDWALTYTLVNAASRIQFTAAADGTAHRVSLAAATTAAYAEGRYDWVAHVSDGVDRHQVGAGALVVLPDLAAAGVTAHDGRSHARRMLEAIESLLEGRALSGDLDLVRAAHGELSAERDLRTLLQLRAQYAAAVTQEDAARRIARGERDPRLLQVRFR